MPLDELTKARARALDAQLGAADRAQAHWKAARLTRTQGMDLMGTEGGPDWHVWGGSHQLADTAAHRLSPKAPTRMRTHPSSGSGMGRSSMTSTFGLPGSWATMARKGDLGRKP